MPSTQPGKPVPLQPTATPEQLIAEWNEPVENLASLGQLSLPLIIGGDLAIIIILALIGFFAHDFTYYLAAVACLAAGAAITGQRRKPATGRDITLTTQHLQVGRQVYLLSDLAGFWLEQAGEVIAVNVEPKKAAMLPINFLYPASERTEARETLLEVLPELESRQKTAADSLNRYLKL